MLTVIERARKYVAKCPSAISGQRGHDATYHVAAVLVHGFALGEPDALTLLREWNCSCVPPWAESDLQYKIKSAANTVHLLPRGHLLGDVAAVTAILDRILHHGHVLKCGPRSWRTKTATTTVGGAE